MTRIWRRVGDGGAHDRDRGSVLVLTAVLMVVLVGMCAFAVDVGQLYNVRRQSQSSVDAAALAGGAELTVLRVDGSERRANAAGWVKAVSHRSAEHVPASPERWNAAWTRCRDAGHLEITSAESAAISDPAWPSAGASECISFSADMRTMRVKLPTQTFETTFARVLGVQDMSTSAIAEVELGPADEGGGILPFAVYAGSSDATSVCAAVTSGAFPEGTYPYDTCDEGNTSGNFGYLNVSVWGNAGRSSDCKVGDSGNSRIAVNMAEGVDHLIAPFAPGDADLSDTGECAGSRRTPNRVRTMTGNMSSTVGAGLVHGGSYDGKAYEGRLTRTEGGTREAYRGSPAIDDVGLWEYIDPDIRYPAVPGTCDPRTFEEGWALTDTPDIDSFSAIDWLGTRYPSTKGDTFEPGNRSRRHMERCLQDYAARLDGGGPGAEMPALFTDELALSPRVGWLPVLEGDEPPSGSSEVRVEGFKLVYLNTLFGKCNPHGCEQIWEPGETTSDAGGERANVALNKLGDIRALGAYMFRSEMLPMLLRSGNPSHGGGVGAVQLSG